MARSKLPESTVTQLLKCQRWGVCDVGTADICAVDLKTVHRFQAVAAPRAQTHHQQVVQQGDVSGVQVDEAHAKLRPRRVEWIHTALAMGSWFLLWGNFGPRTQATAAALIAQVVARAQELPLFLTDGWKASPGALLQVVGVVYRPRRRGKVGRKPKPRLVAPKTCPMRRSCRSATRRAMAWRCAGVSSSVGRAVLARSCASGTSGRRSRPPLGNAGMAPYVGSWRPCGVARGVCPGATLATEGKSGSWSASTTL
jgi:hypothetical protein